MPDLDLPQPSTKAAIVNALARHFRFTSYLELCTPTTGLHFAEIDTGQLIYAHRMMYITYRAYTDGAKISFRSPDEDITNAVADYRAAGGLPQICLVDGWHTYKTSSRDLQVMFDLLPTGGVLVVHDCRPPRRDTATPSFQRGEWCGVTYKAFLDFVVQATGLDYFTVDCDYGCGVIVKGRKFGALLPGGVAQQEIPVHPGAELVWEWADTVNDLDAAYDLFERRQAELLRLISVEAFSAMFGPKAGK